MTEKDLDKLQFATDTNVGGNLISKQAAIDAVDGVDWYHQNKNGEMVHGASDEHQAWYKAEDISKAIESVPSAQLAQDLTKGCTDTISRQAAVETVRKAKSKGEAHRMLIQMPSTQLERPKGEWIYGEHDIAMCDGYRCDQCGFFVPWDYKYKFIDFIKDYHWCPSCGADMRDEQDE